MAIYYLGINAKENYSWGTSVINQSWTQCYTPRYSLLCIASHHVVYFTYNSTPLLWFSPYITVFLLTCFVLQGELLLGILKRNLVTPTSNHSSLFHSDTHLALYGIRLLPNVCYLKCNFTLNFS